MPGPKIGAPPSSGSSRAPRWTRDFVPVPIMLYHNIGSGASFGAELDRYIAFGYTTITLDQLYAYLQNPVAANLPAKPLLITFDDGGQSNYTLAYPELLARGMKATMYLVSDWMDDLMTSAQGPFLEANHFTWANAVEMKASGLIDFQSHTKRHIDMRTLSAVATGGGNGSGAGADYIANKARIEQMIPGQVVQHSAAPGGNINTTSDAAMKAAGVLTQRIVYDKKNYDDTTVDYGPSRVVVPGNDPIRLVTAGSDAKRLNQQNFYGIADFEGQLVWDPEFKANGFLWTKDVDWTVETGVVLPDGSTGKCLKMVAPPGQRVAAPQMFPLGFYANYTIEAWVKLDAMAASSCRLVLETWKADGVTVSDQVGVTTGAGVQGQPVFGGTLGWTKKQWIWLNDLSGNTPFFVRPKLIVAGPDTGTVRLWGMRMWKTPIGFGPIA